MSFGIFFSFIFISWRLITLQYCSDFCHTLTWISHVLTCVPQICNRAFVIFTIISFIIRLLFKKKSVMPQQLDPVSKGSNLYPVLIFQEHRSLSSCSIFSFIPTLLIYLLITTLSVEFSRCISDQVCNAYKSYLLIKKQNKLILFGDTSMTSKLSPQSWNS